MKKTLIFALLLLTSKVIFAQTYPKFVVSDLIVKKLNVGVEQRYKGIGLEAIVDFSKPEFLGTKFFDADSKVRIAYGAVVKFYLDPAQTKKRQHFIGIIAKNTIQKHSFESNLYRKTNQSVGLFYGMKKSLHRNLFYEINLGLVQNFNFRYFDLTRDYEIVTTPNYDPRVNLSDTSNPFFGIGNIGKPYKYDYVSLLFNFSLTYQL